MASYSDCKLTGRNTLPHTSISNLDPTVVHNHLFNWLIANRAVRMFY